MHTTQEKSYIIPLHEFLRAVIFGDNEYYDPRRSAVMNIFDVSSADDREHFIVPILIGLLSYSGNAKLNDGFLELPKIYDSLQGLGYLPEQIDNAIVTAHSHKLIETAARRIPQPGQQMPEALRATTIGIYHITRLCKSFTYYDAIVVDIPIFDTNTRELIHNVHEILARVHRVEVLRAYLDKTWARINGASIYYDWQAISLDLEGEISKVKYRLGRH